MLDNSTEFLISAWQEAWDICESHDWDLESITETDEASCFDGGVNVEATGKDLRLVGDHTDDFALNFTEACDHVFSEVWHDLVEVVAISDVLNHLEHIVWLVWIVWYDIVEKLS